MLHYTDLDVWNLAMDMVDDVYTATKLFPKEELFLLTAQIRKSAVSVPSNIAEGNGRFGKKEYAQFLSNANGSLREVETQIRIAHRQGYIEDCKEILSKCDRIGMMISRLRQSLLDSGRRGISGFFRFPTSRFRFPFRA